MKKIGLLSVAIIAFASNANSSTENHLFSYSVSDAVSSNTQTAPSVNSLKVTTIKINQNADSLLTLGAKFEVSFPNQNNTYNAKVTTELPDGIPNQEGEMLSSTKLIASLEKGAGSVEMSILNGDVKSLFITDAKNNKIYNVELNSQGEGVLVEQDFASYQCAEFPESHNANYPLNIPLSSELTPDLTTLQGLQSRPGATNVIYINNWGGTLSGTRWNDAYNSGNPISYDPFDTDGNTSSFSDNERYLMWLAWKEMAEDYAPFDVNITTSQSVYNNTPVVNRSQIIATTTATRGTFYPNSAGGVAYVGIFGLDSDYYKTGWTWNLSAGSMGMTHSHESGHQMGLSHHGTSDKGYYSGHGVWGPVMGAPFGQSYVQWSKGDYPDANNSSQNDLTILRDVLGVLNDDVANSSESATNLSVPESGYYAQITPNGINDVVDVDVFEFNIATQSTAKVQVQSSLGVEGESRAANLTLKVTLKNDQGGVVATHTSAMVGGVTPLTDYFTYTDDFAPGTYSIHVEAQTPDANWATGFDDYGNGGEYQVSITFDDEILITRNEANLTASVGNEIQRSIIIPEGATEVTVSSTGGTGDVDLYTRSGQAPTRATFDCRSWNGGNDEICSNQTANTELHYMLYAYSDFAGVSTSVTYKISGTLDSDGDGVNNITEKNLGTDITDSDSDSDGLTDGYEVDNNLNPLSSDTDGDGLLDKYEVDNGLNPNDNDQDNDGIIDGQDNDPLVAADSDGDGWDN
ncbi:PPC domain-containing protein, partial [Pseudoalteromonas sp. P1-9]|uniref:PPC domain-containing protein n=1 Tax=Pseudoalteromonas sp. P1-9 TaxID=1710354 RepID=UPI0006D5DA1D